MVVPETETLPCSPALAVMVYAAAVEPFTSSLTEDVQYPVKLAETVNVYAVPAARLEIVHCLRVLLLISVMFST